MKVLSLSLFILITAFIQLRNLIRKKQKREAYVYTGLMVIATYLSIGYILGIYVPNPTNGIKILFEPIQQWIDKLLS